MRRKSTKALSASTNLPERRDATASPLSAKAARRAALRLAAQLGGAFVGGPRRGQIAPQHADRSDFELRVRCRGVVARGLGTTPRLLGVRRRLGSAPELAARHRPQQVAPCGQQFGPQLLTLLDGALGGGVEAAPRSPDEFAARASRMSIRGSLRPGSGRARSRSIVAKASWAL